MATAAYSGIAITNLKTLKSAVTVDSNRQTVLAAALSFTSFDKSWVSFVPTLNSFTASDIVTASSRASTGAAWVTIALIGDAMIASAWLKQNSVWGTRFVSDLRLMAVCFKAVWISVDASGLAAGLTGATASGARGLASSSFRALLSSSAEVTLVASWLALRCGCIEIARCSKSLVSSGHGRSLEINCSNRDGAACARLVKCYGRLDSLFYHPYQGRTLACSGS